MYPAVSFRECKNKNSWRETQKFGEKVQEDCQENASCTALFAMKKLLLWLPLKTWRFDAWCFWLLWCLAWRCTWSTVPIFFPKEGVFFKELPTRAEVWDDGNLRVPYTPHKGPRLPLQEIAGQNLSDYENHHCPSIRPAIRAWKGAMGEKKRWVFFLLHVEVNFIFKNWPLPAQQLLEAIRTNSKNPKGGR